MSIRKWIQGFLWPVNPTKRLTCFDAHFRSFEQQVLPEAIRRGAACSNIPVLLALTHAPHCRVKFRHDGNVQLPLGVRRYIEERASESPFAELKRSLAAMSDAYREGRAFSPSPIAYLVTRMPATYAATYSALRELPVGLPKVETVLDVGAGTGAASLACRELFPEAKISMVERDLALLKEARALLPAAEAIAADAARLERLPQRDLVIAAYSAGEIGAAAIPRLWQAARIALVIIEPGTPKGFEFIRSARADLIAAGAHIAAPCPGAMACPMAGGDWCHFAARVERSSLHRRLKDGDLGYEDEKFSYVAFTREPLVPTAGRIVRHPQHHPGWIELRTCTEAGLETARVTKRDREAFRHARHAVWGGSWINRDNP